MSHVLFVTWAEFRQMHEPLPGERVLIEPSPEEDRIRAAQVGERIRTILGPDTVAMLDAAHPTEVLLKPHYEPLPSPRLITRQAFDAAEAEEEERRREELIKEYRRGAWPPRRR